VLASPAQCQPVNRRTIRAHLVDDIEDDRQFLRVRLLCLLHVQENIARKKPVSDLSQLPRILVRAPSAQAAPSASAAEPLLSYELDRLFRPARRTQNAETAIERAEAGRILLTSSSHAQFWEEMPLPRSKACMQST
jgi:hypothetical protein